MLMPVVLVLVFVGGTLVTGGVLLDSRPTVVAGIMCWAVAALAVVRAGWVAFREYRKEHQALRRREW